MGTMTRRLSFWGSRVNSLAADRLISRLLFATPLEVLQNILEGQRRFFGARGDGSK